MTLLAAVVLLPVLAVTAFLTLGSGGSADHPASPRPTHSTPVEAAEPAAPTWGAYVPPRQVRPSHRTYVRRDAPPPRTRPAHPAPARVCPTSLRRWPWLWEMCKHNQTGR